MKSLSTHEAMNQVPCGQVGITNPEAHIDSCPDCQAKLQEMIEAIEGQILWPEDAFEHSKRYDPDTGEPIE